MLRKIINIVLLIPYIGFGAGITVTVHTCKYEKPMKAMMAGHDMCDCSGHAAKANMCCNTELKTQKIDDAQSITAVHHESGLIALETITVSDVSSIDINHLSFIIPYDTSPPPSQDLYLSNSVFRI